MKSLFVLGLFAVFPLLPMEKQAHLVRVSTADQNNHWDLEVEVIEQISSLCNQKSDNPGAPFLIVSPQVSVEDFSNLLLFVPRRSDSQQISQQKKTALKNKTVSELALFAKNADCVGAINLLAYTISILQKRICNGIIPELPETLQQELASQVVHTNPFIKIVLFNAWTKAREGKVIENPFITFKKTDFLFPNTESYWNELMKMGLQDINNLQFCKCSFAEDLFLTDGQILFYDRIKKKVHTAWKLPNFYKRFAVHDSGIVCILRDEGPYGKNRHLFFYTFGHVEPRTFAPFRTCPTALAYHAQAHQIVAGSAEGEIGVFNMQDPLIDPLILGSSTQETIKRNDVDAVAIDIDHKYVAVGQDKTLGIWSLKRKCYMPVTNFNSRLWGVQFNSKGDLLFAANKADGVSILSMALKKIVMKVTISNDLFAHRMAWPHHFYLHIKPNDSQIELGDLFDAKTIQILPKELQKTVMHLPLPVLDFLIRVGKKLNEGKQISFVDEKNLKEMYRSLPMQLQKLVAENVSWSTWMWL